MADPVHHLVDPTTGRPVDSPWRTVSVAAGSCVDANTASTAAMIMGERRRRAGSVSSGLPARLVRHRRRRPRPWPDGRPTGSDGPHVTAVALPVAATGGKALWYLTRSTGLVALVLLTATVVLGVVASVGWTTERWPRFLSQGVHRNLSLFCVGFVALHVVTTVSDGYVPIGFADAFLPFLTPYRPLWVGLGALAFDLLLVVLVTSALRHRIGYDSWRFVHWLAYLCWPIAMFHSLGSGSDSSLPFALGLDAACTAAVLAAVAWRVGTGRHSLRGRSARRRRGGSGGCCRWPWPCSPPSGPCAPAGRTGPAPRPHSSPNWPSRSATAPSAPLSSGSTGASDRAVGPVHLRPDRVPDHIGPRRPRAGASHPLPAAAGSLVHLAHRGPRRDPGPGWWDRHDLGLGDLRRLPRDGHLAGRRHRGGCGVAPPSSQTLTLTLRTDVNSGALSGTVTGTSS